MRKRAAVAVLVTLLPLAVSACSRKADPPPPPVINDYVTGVQVVGQESAKTTLRNLVFPAGKPDGPTFETTADANIVNGGSITEELTAAAEFTRIRFGIQPSNGASTPPTDGSPAPGFYEIELSGPTDTAELLVSVAQSLPGTAFVFYYAAVNAGGTQGTPARQPVTAIPVGTGEVQVSVSWDAPSDVDLHVIDASGDEIYYDEPESASGGKLDLDSNAECELDNKNSENITFTDAPPGNYKVRVDHWDKCDATKTNYVVTVRVNGQPARTFHGEFTDDGDHGEDGSGVDITTFTVA
jgi:hypothetical protein